MHIHSLWLENFRGFKKQKFEFPERFSVIIGDNGTGKTGVLEGLAKAIGAFLLGFEGLPPRTITKEDIRMQTMGDLSMEPQLPCGFWATADLAEHRNVQFGRYITRISRKTTANTRDARPAMHIAEQMQQAVRGGQPIKLPVFAFHGTDRLRKEHTEALFISPQGSRIEKGYKTALSARSSSKEFLDWFFAFQFNAERLRNENELALLRIVKDAILEMVPFWDEIDYDLVAEDLVGTKRVGDDVTRTPMSLMSDGYRVMVGMVADIAYRCIRLNPHLGADAIKEAEGVILIDEIDLHLHPNWQRTVVGDLKRIFPKLQFVATTHSPFIVQSLENAELIDLNGKEMSSPYVEKSIEEIAAGEMGVENVQRSEKWLEWMLKAEHYFNLLNSGADILQQSDLRAELDRLEEEFAHDPSYVALLRTERRIREAQQ